jgi:signal peptidase I
MKRRRWLLYLLLLLVPLSGCDNSGDRVLVAKFLYDLSPPRRYDVVVFKFPEKPIENGTPKNYIKRLLGLPGELIAIFFGQLYRYSPPADGVPNGIDEKEWQALTKMPSNSPEAMLDVWRSPPKNTSTAEKLWKSKQFEILRKPPAVMLALSRPVYDNDHQAKDLKNVLDDRWAPQGTAAWKADKDNSFKHDGAGSTEHWLRYRHILRPVNWPQGKDLKHWPQLITDLMGYNTYKVHQHSGAPTPNWVGDLMLECKLTVEEPKGEFWMELSKGVDRFQARFNLQTGVCTLYRIVREGTQRKLEKLSEKDTGVKSAGQFLLRFANYDERLTVWVNRDLPFDEGHVYPPPSEVGPDRTMDTEAKNAHNLDGIRNNDLQPASLASVGAKVQVHNIKLWRDTYYTGFTESGMVVCDHCPPNSNSSSIVGEDWSLPDKWGPLHKLEPKTIYVYPGHYLCLGDNSQESSDGRQWGLVPERLMLGRALMVYFPFDRAGRIK